MTEPTDAELQALWSEAVLPDTVTKRLAFSFARAVHAKWGQPAVAPWRSAVLDLIDECPGLTMEQDQWLSRRVKELDFASTPQPTRAQVGAVPLTSAQIEAAAPEYSVDDFLDFNAGVRFAEQHHGIKGEKP